MGSSMKKKKEKAQDFKKTKFKVGKTKAKPSNFTDTSFKSKSIVMGHQSLSTTAPDILQQYKHNLSMASSSKSDKQRQESLSWLTSQLTADTPINPVGAQAILAKLLPLISDSSTPVRSQLLKVFRALPSVQVRHSTEQALLYIRAGMTHLSADISNDSLGFMEWLLETVDEDVVSCPGGWVKTLNTFCAVLGWATSAKKDGWSSGGGRSGPKGKAALNQARSLDILHQFLRVGFKPEPALPPDTKPGFDYLYRVPRDPNAFAYLNLTGPRRDEDGEVYADREARQRVFHRRFFDPVSKGITQVQKEGGITGRAASTLDQLLRGDSGMGDYEELGACESQDLLDLW